MTEILSDVDGNLIARDHRSAGLVSIDEAQKRQLEAEADRLADRLVTTDPHAPAFSEEADRIGNIGQREIAEAAAHTHHFVNRSAMAVDREDAVGPHLVTLRRAIEDLDPAMVGRRFTKRRLLRWVPFSSRLRDYVGGWRSAEKHISTILQRLASGKEEILRDNAAIDAERLRLWIAMERLEQLVHVTATLDGRLERHLTELDLSDPERARALRETALFYARQRRQDLMTQVAVSLQGYLALGIVRRSNVELAKGVDRASTTTVAALRTAVTVSQAVTNQRQVLRQVEIFNAATSCVVNSTGEALRTQTSAIYRQAAAATIPLATLQRTFKNIYEALDTVDASKLRALDAMKAAIDALSSEVDRAHSYVSQSRQNTVAEPRRNDPAMFSA